MANSGNSSAPPPLDVKYHKLATEYSKIRAQAVVLKRAVIEEQNKNSCLRESQRILDTTLRRTEQESDSLVFRNKQLEHRILVLQEDLDRESKKLPRNAKSKSSIKITDPVFTEELQKKIIENAQLASLVADKNAEIQLFNERINELARKQVEQADVERRLRRDLDALIVKNGLLEQRLTIDGSSIIGSDDTISVADSDHNTPMHQPNNTSLTAATIQQPMSSNTVTAMNAFNVEKVAHLEKELFQLKTKLDFLGVCDTTDVRGDNTSPQKNDVQILCNGAASSVSPCTTVASIDTLDGETDVISKDQLIYDHFTAKMDQLYTEKVKADSQVATLLIECESFSHNLEFVNAELAETEQRLMNFQRQLQISEEDLATTRYNYEEQISVLTEQVINLSDQLASLK